MGRILKSTGGVRRICSAILKRGLRRIPNSTVQAIIRRSCGACGGEVGSSGHDTIWDRSLYRHQSVHGQGIARRHGKGWRVLTWSTGAN